MQNLHVEPVDRWNIMTSRPIADVMGLRYRFHRDANPTVVGLWMGFYVWRALTYHPEILNRRLHPDVGVSPDYLARLFVMDEVVISSHDSVPPQAIAIVAPVGYRHPAKAVTNYAYPADAPVAPEWWRVVE